MTRRRIVLWYQGGVGAAFFGLLFYILHLITVHYMTYNQRQLGAAIAWSVLVIVCMEFARWNYNRAG